MYLPPYDDDDGYDDELYGRPAAVESPKDLWSGIWNYQERLYCEQCKKWHHTTVRGAVPLDKSVPCYQCWWQDNGSDVPEGKKHEPEKVAAPKAVEEDEYDLWDDYAAGFGFGFGI